MKDLQVTLYDAFGYLVPGSVFLAALVLIFWTFFLPPVGDLSAVTASGWIVLLGLAYVMGHVVQALANLGMRRLTSTVDLVLDPRASGLPPEIRAAANHKIRKAMQLDDTETPLSARSLFEACDHYVQQNCNTATRDVYVYREGFYRGMTVATAMIGLGLLIRSLVPGADIRAFGLHLHFTMGQGLTSALLCVAFSVLFFQRFRRFGEYLIRYAIFSTLLTITKKPE
jgi:hypothetical protein